MPLKLSFNHWPMIGWLVERISTEREVSGLQCRRILGGRKLLLYVRIVVTAIFDFMTEEDWEE